MFINFYSIPYTSGFRAVNMKNTRNQNGLNNAENQNFKEYNMMDSLGLISSLNKGVLNFRGNLDSYMAQRMEDELYFIADDVLQDVKEIVSIYKKGTRKFFKQTPETGDRTIVIDGNTMIEYTKNGRRESVFKDKKPVKIVEYNETDGKKNIINFTNGIITLYQEGISERPSHYDEIDLEIFFENGRPAALWKQILRNPKGEEFPMQVYDIE